MCGTHKARAAETVRDAKQCEEQSTVERCRLCCSFCPTLRVGLLTKWSE